MSKKYLTPEDLENWDPKKPLWAINSVSSSESVGQAGELYITIPKINGSKSDTLHLPQTWLPTRVTNQIPFDQLMASSEFRKAITNKHVTLITPEYAEKLMAEEGSKEEADRLSEAKRAVREATAARPITDTEITGGEAEESVNKPSKKKALDASFVMWANNLGEKSDIDVLNLVRGRGKYTKAELRLLAQKINKETHPKVRAMIDKRLAAV